MSFRSKIATPLAISMALVGCDSRTAVPPNTTEQQCWTEIEDGRRRIFCLIDKKEKPLKKVSQQELETAQIDKKNQTAVEHWILKNRGGHFFKMRRLPEMKRENPNARGKVYMRFPEDKKGSPRAIVYFHGNGSQGFGYKNEMNVIRISQEMQEAGDEVILIAPEDGWGNFKPEEGYKKKPGNWRDFNNSQTLANLLKFAERMYGHKIKHITLASFSGGNLGTKKCLRALEKSKGQDAEMRSIYERIQQIAYFDSATGSESDHLARWAASHPKGKIWNCFNAGGIYRYGNELLMSAMAAHNVNPERIKWEHMKHGEGHGLYEDYFRRFTSTSGN